VLTRAEEKLLIALHRRRERERRGLFLAEGVRVAEALVASSLTVELAVKETDPGVRGDTAQGGTKPAVMETGLVVQVPLFIEEGETLKIDSRTGKYLGRV